MAGVDPQTGKLQQRVYDQAKFGAPWTEEEKVCGVEP